MPKTSSGSTHQDFRGTVSGNETGSWTCRFSTLPSSESSSCSVRFGMTTKNWPSSSSCFATRLPCSVARWPGRPCDLQIGRCSLDPAPPDRSRQVRRSHPRVQTGCVRPSDDIIGTHRRRAPGSGSSEAIDILAPFTFPSALPDTGVYRDARQLTDQLTDRSRWAATGKLTHFEDTVARTTEPSTVQVTSVAPRGTATCRRSRPVANGRT